MSRLLPARLLRFAGAMVVAALMPVAAKADQTLFDIHRSKNHNVVRYDVRTAPDGFADKDEPIRAYWVRGDDGSFKELDWIQRKFAYGFDAACSEDRHRIEMELNADVGRKISADYVEERYIPRTVINDRTATLAYVYVASEESLFGLVPKVLYVEFAGRAADDGAVLCERYEPGGSSSVCTPREFMDKPSGNAKAKDAASVQ